MTRETQARTEQQLFLERVSEKTLTEINGSIAYRKARRKKGETNPQLDWEMAELEKRKLELEEKFRQEIATKSSRDLEISIEMKKWELGQLEEARENLKAKKIQKKDVALEETKLLEETKTTLPDYASREEIEADKERIKTAFAEKIKESLEAMEGFKNLLFNRGEERRKEMLKEHPEYQAFENLEKDQPNEQTRRSRVYAKGKDGNWVNDPNDRLTSDDAPAPGIVGVYVDGGIHHKPVEELLACVLKLGVPDFKKNTISKKEFLFKADDNEYQTLNFLKDREFKDAMEFYSTLFVFFSRQVFHNLFRTEYLIKTYYPDNEEYAKFIKPIQELRMMLKKIGIKIPDSPLLNAFDEDTKDKYDEYRSSYSPDIMLSVPTIVRRIKEEAKAQIEIHYGDKSKKRYTMAIDVNHVGYEIDPNLAPSKFVAERGEPLSAGRLLYPGSGNISDPDQLNSIRIGIY